ncbi:MAG: DNA polymerase III subunit alpha [Bacilli bacterium]|nr:DNA polymerase III subunit alpha [Bacilli bacterium]
MYTPLYIKSNYSLLSSLIKIDDLIVFAKTNNISSLALVDNNLYGAMEFYKKCKSNNIKPIIGLEINMDNNIILLYAKNYDGYINLLKLSTIQSERIVKLEDLELYKDNLILIIINNDIDISNIDKYYSYSNFNQYNEVVKKSNKIVYLNKILYLKKEDSEYLKYLYMIRDSKTIADIVSYDIDNYEFKVNLDTSINYSTSNIIRDLCNLDIPFNQLYLPKYNNMSESDSFSYLNELCRIGLSKRLNDKVPNKYIERINYELDVIKKMGFSDYFLVVFDFIKYAKKKKILVGPGRGSAASSLVSYSLGITDIDPIKYDLLFERFLNPERITMPDIDTDFPDIYRDEIIEYVVNKYGNKYVAGIITFGTMSVKQVIRDTSRVLNVPLSEVDLITKKIPSVTKLKIKDFYHDNNDFKNIIDSDNKLKLMYKISSVLEGFPRHTSVHAAGIVMSSVPLDNIVPLVKDNNMYVSGYQADYLEELGLLKMDFLGLKNLTTIMNIIKDINEKEKIDLDFSSIPLDKKEVFDLFSRGDTLGIFQFESVGIRNFLSKLKPKDINDLFAAIALFRPGPAVNIDSYIRRNHKEEEVTYIDDKLEDILKSTYGIIVYQEQIMQIANIYAGYSLGEADILRRAMSKKKMDVLKNEEDKFINRSTNLGHSIETSKKIFDLILNFANYGFNKSHSVAYAIIAYKMAYLKVFYPKYFYSNLLTSVMGSDIKTKEYIDEIRRLGIKILKPSVNYSFDNYVASEEGIIFPISNIKSIGNNISMEIINNRGFGYLDIYDFIGKVKVNKKILEILVYSDSLSCFQYNKKTFIENIDNLINYSELTKEIDPNYVIKPEIVIYEEYDKEYLLAKEKEVFGFYLNNHPVNQYKLENNNNYHTNNIREYFSKNVVMYLLVERVKVVLTKSNTNMSFITGSDEYGSIDVTLFPKIYEDNMDIKVGNILKIEGRIERRFDQFQLIANKIDKIG